MRLIKKGARNASNSDTFWQVDDIYVIVTTQVWRMMMMNMNMEKDNIVVKQVHNRDKDLSMMFLMVFNGGEINTKIQS